MDSATRDEATSKGVMWELDQSLDQPMDEEAGRLRNMYREKVLFLINLCWQIEQLALLLKKKYPSEFSSVLTSEM
jgi:hypothetical protein